MRAIVRTVQRWRTAEAHDFSLSVSLLPSAPQLTDRAATVVAGGCMCSIVYVFFQSPLLALQPFRAYTVQLRLAQRRQQRHKN